ncbi:MAG: hypothetical protein AAF388_26430 [Bacteroidota bacterium]
MKANSLQTLTVLLFFPTVLLSQTLESLSPSQSWFHQERFLIADLNADAFLDQKEISQWQELYQFYGEDRIFTLTDKNQDGHLSLYELTEMYKEEHSFLQSHEGGRIKELNRIHGAGNLNSQEYLLDHPKVMRELFGNYSWLSDNRKLAKSIYENQGWMSDHEEAEITLHKNLRWLVANPLQATELYTNHQITCKLPALLSWRIDHKAFMKRHEETQKWLTTSAEQE